MAEHIYIIRHGQSTFNAAYGESGEDPMIFDAPLSPLGHRQVAAGRVEWADLHPDLVVVTPFTRAIQTGLGIFGDRGLPFLVHAGHREMLGASCDVGRPPDVLAAEFPELDFSHLDDPWWYAPPGGETPFDIEPHTQVRARVAAFRDWVRQRPEPTIVAVGHATFFMELSGHVLANCEMTPFRL